MGNNTKFYIDGAWVDPQTPHLFDVINPATEEVAGQISLGSSADVDRAVAAARRAFTTYSQTSRDERLALLQRIIDGFEARNGELARAMTRWARPSRFPTRCRPSTRLLISRR